ncbi:Pentatricopeptide repeat-containing protein [Forsythia ovata]|uniref:Pentatricopeptide repeat-containing protein n=1 Tax=Forsythia ovata TaxID=205694 RepID=A0ABD1PVA2_9LAMI
MPSPFHRLQTCLPFYEIQKFIPRKWRQNINQPLDVREKSEPQSLYACKSIIEFQDIPDESMVDCLLITLKDFASQGRLSKAFKTFTIIRNHAYASASCDLIVHSLSSLLLSCTNLKLLSEGKQLHTQVITWGLHKNRALVPKLVTFYTAFNFLDSAHIITVASNVLHPLPWNILISSYVSKGHFKDAIFAYKQMVYKGIRPDNFTYPSVLKACGEQLDLGFGMEIHKSINASSLEWNLFVQNALVSMYGKCGEVDTARNIFDKMPVKDDVSWNSIISGYASKGEWGEAFKLFESMRESGVELNIITWNTIAGGCLRTGNYEGTLKLLCQMRMSGNRLDPVAMIIGLGACSHIGVLKLGKEIHGLAVRNCFVEYINVKNALINMYCRCGELMHAYILFQSVEPKTTITWNSMISGYAHWDRYEEASFLFREMLLGDIEPNHVTIASILPLCARMANLQHGKEFHCYITKQERFKDYLLTWNALVDMYSRSGKVSVARRLFDLLDKRDAVTYTSLIAGYGMQGEGKVALELFEDMISSHIKPDDITIVAVLSACSHSGLVVQGQVLFEKMPSIYGITPRLEHFACMVDLFGRAGLLKKAEEIILMMPYKPTSEMWATLLGACRIHGNTDIGERAAEKLLELKPEHSGYHVLIANMYAAAGSWSKLAEVRTFMRDLGVRKDPGCAWVDIGAGFSPFLVEDTSNSQTDEIYLLLGGLTEQIKDIGYVAREVSALEEEFFVDSLV